MTYDEWEQSVDGNIRSDPAWKVKAYRLAMFASDLAWFDVLKLLNHGGTIKLADQLYRASGNIGSNVVEGCSRGTPKARIVFFEYGLGSARETRDWYWRGRHVIGVEVATHRIAIQAEIIQLILGMITAERRKDRSQL